MSCGGGDILVTHDGTEWEIDSVELVREGVRLRLTDIPFPWLFAYTELVCFKRPEPEAVYA